MAGVDELNDTLFINNEVAAKLVGVAPRAEEFFAAADSGDVVAYIF